MKRRPVQPTHLERIPAFPKRGKRDGVVHAVIETPKHSARKYAFNDAFGIIAFREAMPDGLTWPFDYGFVPQTLADDGDPLDILVLTDDGLFSGCLLTARVVGAVRERKNGVENDRLIGVPLPSAGAPKPSDAYHDVADLPPSLRHEIVRFLVTYSERQGNAIEVRDVVGAKDALRSVRKTMRAFAKQHDG